MREWRREWGGVFLIGRGYERMCFVISFWVTKEGLLLRVLSTAASKTVGKLSLG
jgi:hypothetical protein